MEWTKADQEYIERLSKLLDEVPQGILTTGSNGENLENLRNMVRMMLLFMGQRLQANVSSV